MKKLLFATSAIVVLTTCSALAADMAPRYTKAPPIMAPAWSWTGFYTGLHVGAGWTDSSIVSTNQFFPGLDPGVFGNNNNAGVVAGGQIGYNWQFAPNWVLGIEGDISGTGIRNNNTGPITVGGVPVAPFGVNHVADQNINWMASVRGRLGYTWDRWMVYGTGGTAWADVDYRTDYTGVGTNNPLTTNRTLSGWVAGGGVEWAVANSWTVKAEYLYYDFGNETVLNPTQIPSFNQVVTFDTKVHAVRAGVNYKF